MTFRQGGRLDTSGVSGGGRGGRGGRVVAIGGGVGGIVVVVIALFLGVDPAQLGLTEGGSDEQGQNSSSA